ncbi:MAG: hypothetical protein LC637_04730, partial [Xanthomonadaceae bacterium]|nr:hypothetical protein [Xanthomonadaceae bacterium]
MKKRLPIIIVLFGVLVAAALPAAVGWIARDQIDHSLAENGLAQDAEWQAGWTRSTLRLRNPGVNLELRMRHVPLRPVGWLAFSGRAIVTQPAATLDLQGQIALDGRLEAFASAPGLQIYGPATWNYRQPELRLVTRRDGSM